MNNLIIITESALLNNDSCYKKYLFPGLTDLHPIHLNLKIFPKTHKTKDLNSTNITCLLRFHKNISYMFNLTFVFSEKF